MYIYKITNIINNKLYIGQTIRPIERRFNRHINDATNHIIDTHLARAINKYGKENFKIALLDSAETAEELTEKEIFWIKELNAIKEGYNETDAAYKCGGNTYVNKTEEEMNKIKENLSRSKMGGKNPMAKKIKRIDIINNTIEIFDSVIECARSLGIKGGRTSITQRLNGTIKSPYKNQFMFEYINN